MKVPTDFQVKKPNKEEALPPETPVTRDYPEKVLTSLPIQNTQPNGYFPALPVITIVLQILNEKNNPEPKPNNGTTQEVPKEEMTSACRVLSFFFVIFVIPTILISVPLYARYYMYSAKTMFFTDGDMHSLHKDVSHFWCQGQRVISNATFDAYLTPEPRRVKRHRRRMELASELLLMHDDVEQWGFYLIKGSRFSFDTCSRWPGATLIVVKGEDNLRRCFYKEEKLLNELNENNKHPNINENVEEPVNWRVEPEIKKKLEEDNEGGEAIDMDYGDSDTLSSDSIKQMYVKNQGKNDESDAINKQRFKRQLNKKVSDKSLSMVRNDNESDSIRMTETVSEDIGVTEQYFKAVNSSLAKNMLGNGTKTNANEETADEMRSIPVNKGSFFYNVKDTMDVTWGNSSYSSSEEFLEQCSDTIVSIELNTYLDCKSQLLNETVDKNTWRFAANESDFYYFIFFSDNSIEANVISFRLHLQRTLYDISEEMVMQNCTNSSECVFPFSFLESGGVILDYPNNNKNVSELNHLHNFELLTICQPRRVVYTVFILLVPFIIFLFAFRS